MKILLIEDDCIIGKNIKEFLENYSFQVEWFRDWKNWEEKALYEKYDIFLFDVMLPIKNWFEIAKKVREKWIETPIIFLTAKEDLDSKEKGFWVWWDDYLTKPFKMKELVLRIKSILKRVDKSSILKKIEIWDIEINLLSKEVKRWWKIINLTIKEYWILEYLAKNKWRTISKNELLNAVWWPNNDIWSDPVRTHIQWLRSKLNDWFDFDPIKTVRWLGFIIDK